MKWEVNTNESSILEAFVPDDVTGPHVYAWRMVKKGDVLMTVKGQNTITKKSGMRFIHLFVDPGWTPRVVTLDETYAGKTVNYGQRDQLKVALAHPNNEPGYWEVDMGSQAVEGDSPRAATQRGVQIQTATGWRTEMDIATPPMPGRELKLNFYSRDGGQPGPSVRFV